MEDLFRRITPEDLDGDLSAFFDKLQAVQKELAAYIDKTFPIGDELPESVQKTLNMSLGTLLIAIGITKIKAAGTNPVKFLAQLIQEAMFQQAASDVFGKLVDAPIPSVPGEKK